MEKIEQIEAQISKICYQIEMAKRRHRWRRVEKLHHMLLQLIFTKYALLGIFSKKYHKYIDSLPFGEPGPSCSSGPLAPSNKSTQILSNGKININWKIVKEEVRSLQTRALQEINKKIGCNYKSIQQIYDVLYYLDSAEKVKIMEILEFYSSIKDGGANLLPK